MDMLLKDCKPFAAVYINDTAVYSEMWDKHLQHLRTILEKLREAQTKEVLLCKEEVEFLGHSIVGGFVRPLEAKIQAIKNFK